MKIVQEIFDKEIFIDQILNGEDFEKLENFMLLSYPLVFEGKKVNLGIKLSLYDEND